MEVRYTDDWYEFRSLPSRIVANEMTTADFYTADVVIWEVGFQLNISDGTAVNIQYSIENSSGTFLTTNIPATVSGGTLSFVTSSIGYNPILAGIDGIDRLKILLDIDDDMTYDLIGFWPLAVSYDDADIGGADAFYIDMSPNQFRPIIVP